ncbi:helix-turn-helix domain-containing protein [Catenuloplanes atrovinosus]|uniref:helix-turn-helix domain-containing protein n=1 Tax=Catenuloplanes atrovinosus TaxID=137266 RepID=UPI0035B54B6B
MTAFAVVAGISRQYVFHIECGHRRTVSPETYKQIIDALGVDYDTLIKPEPAAAAARAAPALSPTGRSCRCSSPARRLRSSSCCRRRSRVPVADGSAAVGDLLGAVLPRGSSRQRQIWMVIGCPPIVVATAGVCTYPRSNFASAVAQLRQRPSGCSTGCGRRRRADRDRRTRPIPISRSGRSAGRSGRSRSSRRSQGWD